MWMHVSLSPFINQWMRLASKPLLCKPFYVHRFTRFPHWSKVKVCNFSRNNLNLNPVSRFFQPCDKQSNRSFAASRTQIWKFSKTVRVCMVSLPDIFKSWFSNKSIFFSKFICARLSLLPEATGEYKSAESLKGTVKEDFPQIFDGISLEFHTEQAQITRRSKSARKSRKVQPNFVKSLSRKRKRQKLTK